MNHNSQKMLEDTTQEKQAMGSSNARWKTRTSNDAGVVPTGCKTTEEEWTTVEGGKDMVAEDRQVKSSIATTVSSESKQTGSSSNPYTSSHILEEETDPTSSPSEMWDEPDRKCTESPIDSDRAVRGSNSLHSESSESSTEHNDSRKNSAAAIDLDKVEAMGGQFDGLGTGREAASFHNPVNDVEARYINDKVIKANSEPFKFTVLSLVTDDLGSYHGGHQPSSRGTFPGSRVCIPGLCTTQRAFQNYP